MRDHELPLGLGDLSWSERKALKEALVEDAPSREAAQRHLQRMFLVGATELVLDLTDPIALPATTRALPA